MSKKRGKYLKEVSFPKRRGKPTAIVLAFMTVILLVVLVAMLWLVQTRSVYQTIVRDGYTGTQEQWIASLVGEETDGDAEKAYELAVKNGYKGSETEWIKALVGVSVEAVHASPYELACENGFKGSLTEWLMRIADKPEDLGKSSDDGTTTEYELACGYGYSGTFIEWLVSVTHDRVFE